MGLIIYTLAAITVTANAAFIRNAENVDGPVSVTNTCLGGGLLTNLDDDVACFFYKTLMEEMYRDKYNYMNNYNRNVSSTTVIEEIKCDDAYTDQEKIYHSFHNKNNDP